MSKFKKGDQVRFLGGEYSSADAGAQAVVVVPEYTNDLEYTFMQIKWDRSVPGSHSQMDGGYREENFELVAPEKAKPEPGKRYRISREVRLVEHATYDDYAVVDGGDGEEGYFLNEFEWEELPDPEPEYVDGALYQDALGRLFEYDPLDEDRPWATMRFGNREWEHPRRPLTRLYTLDEAVKELL